jgi:hypothetical protein
MCDTSRLFHHIGNDNYMRGILRALGYSIHQDWRVGGGCLLEMSLSTLLSNLFEELVQFGSHCGP